MVDTITARPMTFEDVTALAENLTVAAYRPHPLFPHQYEQVTLTVPQGKSSRQNPRDVTVKDDAGVRVVGQALTVDIVSMSGSHSGGVLHTTPAAEQEASRPGRTPTANELRLTTLLASEQTDDPDVVTVPLVPTFGAKASLSLIVEGVTPDEIQARLRKAIAAEFGTNDASVRIGYLTTRPVLDVRVTVLSGVARDVLAVNVLDAESGLYANGMYTVVPSTIPVGR